PGGWAPPGPVPPGMPPGPPRAGKPKTGLIVVLLGGFMVLVLAGAGVFFALNAGPEWEVNAPGVAGGLEKTDATAGESPVFNSISTAVRRGDFKENSSATAIYRSPGTGGNLLLFAGTGKIGDPEDFLRKARPLYTLQTSPIWSSGDDTKEVCGTYRLIVRTMMYCAWATSSSYGFIAPDTPITIADYSDLKILMGRMRSDVQTKAD
ncbi:MAG TPA: hypothetical protein VIL71_07955, partial [Spirillospora sp.]